MAMAGRGGIEALLYLLDEAFGGAASRRATSSQALLPQPPAACRGEAWRDALPEGRRSLDRGDRDPCRRLQGDVRRLRVRVSAATRVRTTPSSVEPWRRRRRSEMAGGPAVARERVHDASHRATSAALAGRLRRRAATVERLTHTAGEPAPDPLDRRRDDQPHDAASITPARSTTLPGASLGRRRSLALPAARVSVDPERSLPCVPAAGRRV